jgi:hypothetical protein
MDDPPFRWAGLPNPEPEATETNRSSLKVRDPTRPVRRLLLDQAASAYAISLGQRLRRSPLRELPLRQPTCREPCDGAISMPPRSQDGVTGPAARPPPARLAPTDGSTREPALPAPSVESIAGVTTGRQGCDRLPVGHITGPPFVKTVTTGTEGRSRTSGTSTRRVRPEQHPGGFRRTRRDQRFGAMPAGSGRARRSQDSTRGRRRPKPSVHRARRSTTGGPAGGGDRDRGHGTPGRGEGRARSRACSIRAAPERPPEDALAGLATIRTNDRSESRRSAHPRTLTATWQRSNPE